MGGLSELEALVFGVVGGLVPELVALYRLRKEPQLPAWFKSPIYWTITVAMIAAGGGLSVLYVRSGVNLSAILALNVGASAPLILGTIGNKVPDLKPGRIG
ncbi:MAG: hypothetical protein JWN10_2283 [Solirubrobacterales bacterium]|nr:hypothetical protein [Solirubrobacterales bacterium]